MEIQAQVRKDLCQQHGYLHAGVVTALIDAACGYRASPLRPPGTEVLTVGFTVNFLALPGDGGGWPGLGGAGRQVHHRVCGSGGRDNHRRETTVATMLATMLIVDSQR